MAERRQGEDGGRQRVGPIHGQLKVRVKGRLGSGAKAGWNSRCGRQRAGSDELVRYYS